MIRYDKVAHFAGGAIIAGLLYPTFGLGYALLSVTLVAVGKEYIYDRIVPKHTTDPMDALATMAGGLLVLMFV